MLNNNQLKLIIISTATLILSGFLFYEGLKPQVVPDQRVKQSTISKNIPKESSGEAKNVSADEQTSVKVVKVVDGDTIEVEYLGENRKLRYIGVDTPETVDPRRPLQCFGKEASNENRYLVEGKTVSLEKDVSDTDKFGRLLRYVYIKLDDGTTLFINDYLVREGFAQVNSFPPDIKYQERFIAAQKEARENNRGLWSRCK